MSKKSDRVKELEEHLFEGAYRFSQRITPNHQEEADALMAATADELATTIGEERYQSIEDISKRLNLTLSAFDKLVLAHYDFEKLAAEFVEFIHDHEDALRQEFSKEQYNAHTPDEWLSMDVWDAWRSPEYLQAMNAVQGGNPPRTILKEVTDVTYPLDKINSNIWNFLNEAADGQLTFNFDTTGKGKKEKVAVIFSINFDGLALNVSKKLSQYDKRVYIACDALWKAGNPVFSISQLYRAMGNTGTPSAEQLKKLNNSLSKMRVTIISVDNHQEVDANYKYSSFVYDAPLLPFERVTGYFGNHITEAAIALMRRPPLSEFAERRGHVTKIPHKLLQSPISKTEKNLALDDYLLERIGRMKGKEKNSRKILLSTVFKECHISEKKDIKRTPEKLCRLLTYYQKCGWIKGFSIDEEAIKIKL